MDNGSQLVLAEPGPLLDWFRTTAEPWIRLVLAQQDSLEGSYSRPESLRASNGPLTRCPVAGQPNFRVREVALKCETFAFMQPRAHLMRALLPHLRAHGEGGYVVNTASMAGLISPPGMEPYCASKYAVVALSEGWGAQLAPENIGVGVLCPGFVKTRIDQSRRNRPDRFGGPDSPENLVASEFVQGGIDPARVGRRVLEAIRNDERYIFTHPGMRAAVQDRFARIMTGFDQADASPALQGLEEPVFPVDGLRPAD